MRREAEVRSRRMIRILLTVALTNKRADVLIFAWSQSVIT